MKPKLQTLDESIRYFRNLYHESATFAAGLELLEYVDKLQRIRWKHHRAFLPHSDGLYYLYDVGMAQWTKWISLTSLPA